MDVNAILTVPESFLPTIQDPSTNRLADQLGSLYIEGNTNRDSYVGQSTSTTIMHTISRPSSPRGHNQLQERFVGLASQIETLKVAFRDQLIECRRGRMAALSRVQVILEVETYDRILQAYNDLIFQQLRYYERDALRKIGVYYIKKLLDPPTNLDDNDLKWVDYALAKLSSEQYQAARALLPILNHLQSGPFGRNAIQYSIPTIDEGIRHIENSSLSPSNKSTLIDSLTHGLETLRGDPLFLPSNNGETDVETLEREIKDLEVRIAELR